MRNQFYNFVLLHAKIILLFILWVQSFEVTSQISGLIYHDYNSNGARDNTASFVESGIQGVTIRAYDSDDIPGNPTSSVVSAADGSYTLTGLTPGTTYRLEIEWNQSYLRAGAAGGTSVRFVPDGTSNIHFGLNNPADYCQDNPNIFTNCYIEHDQSQAPNSNLSVLIQTPYNSGNASATMPGVAAPSPVNMAIASQIGTTYGLAYQKSSSNVFAASYMKRHTGFGPGGIGAIYKIDMNSNAVTTFLDFTTLFGAGTIGTDPHPNAPNNDPLWQRDANAWDPVGKRSFGDIDISEDELFLWTVNLFDRKLYKIPLSSATNPVAPTSGQIESFPSTGNLTGLSGLTGSNLANDIRPFGLGIKNGLVYIGLVHSAETSQSAAEMRGFVYSFDPNTEVFTKVIEFPLNYTRRFAINDGSNNVSANWRPWVTTFTVNGPVFGNEYAYPQAIISDITFDHRGNMILGLRDRFGDQMGFQQLHTTLNDGLLYSGDSAGDLLMASPNGTGGFTIENNAQSNPAGSFGPSAGAGNTEGPGGGEFYYQDRFPVSSNTIHDEVIVGGLLHIAGRTEVAATQFDPIDDPNTAFDGGIFWMNNVTGQRARGYLVFDGGAAPDSYLGKSNGLGDLEAMCNPAPVEIGNRLWVDADKDGIQDPDELPLAGVTIELVKNGTVISTVVSDINGNYLFSNGPGTDTANKDYGITALEPGMEYILRIPNASGGSKQISLGSLVLTTADADGGSPGVQADVRDSDGVMVGVNAEVTVSASQIAFAGANNHTFDFGFNEPCLIDIVSVTRSNCNQLTNMYSLTVIVSYSNDPGGNITIETSNGASITVPATSSPQTISILSIVADGVQDIDVTAFFENDNLCTTTQIDAYDAPASCLASGACACTDFIYLNEPVQKVHKFEVEPGTGSLTEIKKNGQAWYPGGGTSELPSPHGLGVDRNGYLYIGENFSAPNRIRRLNCAGEIFPVTTFSTPSVGFLLSNIQSYEGFIYSNGTSNRIYKWDPCSGNQLGYISFVGTEPDWGFYIDENGKFYITTVNGRVYAINPTDNDFVVNTNYTTPLIDLGANPTQGGLLSPAYSGTGLQGVTTDDLGNIYIVEGNRDVGGTPSRLLKFSSTGSFVVAGPIDNTPDIGGWNQMTGVVYSKSSGMLYTSSLSSNADCARMWNTDLTDAGTAVPPTFDDGGNRAKAIGILTECCPTTTPVTITETVCNPTMGQKISLADFLQCDGIICEGQWSPDGVLSGMTFNDCDLTVTINDNNACGSFILESTGDTGPDDPRQCPAFQITLNLSTNFVQAPEIGSDINVCANEDPGNFTIITPAQGTGLTYIWQSSITSCTSGFQNIPGGPNSEVYNPGPLTQTTYFRVITEIVGCNSGVCADTSNCVTLTIIDCSSLDAALSKVITSPMQPVQVGDNVIFTITAYNQGTDAIDSIQIADYIPAGLIFNAGNNPNWTGTSPTVYYTATVANGLLPVGGIAPSSSVSFTITLEVSAGANANNVDNFAEITGVRDVVGNENGDDVDSTPDNNPNNDAGGQINSPADNHVDGDGTGSPGDGIAATDEDDHDGARVRFVDLSLTKEISVSSPPPYTYGSPVTYVITVSNQSNEAVQNIEIEDDLPAGFSFVPNNGWIESTPGNLTTTIAGPLAPGASTSVNLILTPIPSNQPNAWINYAQITGFEDEGGDPIGDRDFDSEPGNGPSGGTEDDDDNAVIEIFDLALRKTLLTPAPYSYGQTLTFEIEVFNQGNVPATNIIVNDYIPNGYSYTANNGWTGTYPNLQNTIPGPIAPGASATIQLELTLQTSPTGSFTNYAEIAAGDGPSGPGFDADSNPDSNSTEEQDVEPGDPDDDNINGGGPNAGEDEDDHDPAGPAIFDLALRKTVDTALPSYSYGQDVMYTITVFNQGNIPARDIVVRDTIPCGFEFDPSDPANSGWTQSGQVITTTISSVLNPGQFTDVMVNYIVQPCYTDPATAWTNYAEISEAINDNTGLPGDDIDSTPDDNMGNDSGGVPDFNGVMSGTDNTINNENGDEDDHDPHQIQVFDLALRKVLTTAGPYSYGQLLTFTIEVFNQGNVTAQNIVISDYVPQGYSFVANNGWTSVGPGLLQNTIAGPLAPGAFTTLTLALTLETGVSQTSWDNYAEVSASQDDQGNNRNDDADSVADTNENNDNPVLPGDMDDNNIQGGGPNVGEDEDDHDPAAPVIIDIALNKTVTTAGPYSYGQTVSYDITLTNQGNIPLTNIVVKDELPCGMVYNGGSQPWTVVGNEATTTYTGTLQPFTSATISITVTLQACYTNPASAWTNIAQVVSMEDENGDDVSDDDVDSDPDNDDPTEDDQDEETIEIFDLALRKILLTPPPYSYGQVLTFGIEVFNQGNVPATNIIVKDYLPNGYSYVANNGWTGSYPNLQNTIAGPIVPGGSATLPLQVTLQASPDGSFANYAEIAAGDGPTGPGFDADSNPDSDTSTERDVEPGDADDDNINGGGPNAGEDEDDHDPAGPAIFDLALRKTVDTALPSYSYGQDVMYTITIYNQGSVAARDIEIRDTIPCGFEFDPSDPANAGWTQSGQVITYTITSVLNPGQFIPISVRYIVRPCYTDPAAAWTNYAEIGEAINNDTSLPGNDIDSTPDDNMDNDSGGVPDFNGVASGTDNTINNENGDEDDHDPHKIQVFDLALRKVLTTAGPYNYGQLLTFTVEVYNQGNVTAENIVISDYVPDGFTFVNNNGWTVVGPGLLQNTIAGPIAPGAFTTLTLQLTMTTGTTQLSWDNYAEVSASQDDQGNNRNDDADSVLDSNENNDNPVSPGDADDDNITGLGPNAGEDEDDHDPAAPVIVDIALEKTITTAGPYSYGQTVSYDITLTNEGNIPLTNIVVKDELPCGMVYSGGSQPWTINGNKATTMYTGTLQPFASATISITVTLNACYTNPAAAWTNIAQVVSMEDEDGDDVSDDDVDSDPDNDDPTEDDQDEETIEIFDLALRKTLLTTPPYSYNSMHTFTVEVFNQGNVPATNVVVNDYVPVGYGFTANNGWTSAGPGLIQNTIAGPIMPGGSITLTLQLTLLQSDGGERNWINYAEISSGNGPSGPGFDADSSPNSNGANENAIVPGGLGDNDITSTTDSGIGSQDDHDPAGPSIFDLALTKIAVTATPSYSYGQVVTYEIEIFNQGNVSAGSIQVSDYIPCGLSFEPGLPNNALWYLAGPDRASIDLNIILPPGQSTTVLLDLRVQDCQTNPATAWTNFTEITLATDVTTGLQGNDIDSDPDAINGNDNGGVPDFNGVTSGTDNKINNENGDEDDHDPHQIQVFDLALRKVLVTSEPYTVGQLLTFTVDVFNQGNVTAENIVISDYVPDGYTFVNNNGWTNIGPGLIQNTISGPLSPGTSVTLTLQLTLTAGTSITSWDNYAEVSASQDNQGNNRNDDADSVLDSNENNDNPVSPGDADDDNILGLGPNAGEDEDDHDPAAPVIVDIALEKTITTSAPYSYGQTVSYNITLTNEGNVPLTNIVVKDELPCGMVYSGGSQPWTINGNEATTMYTGTLQPFTSATISITVTLNACYTNPATAWTNIAQVVSMEDEDGDDVSDDDVDSDPDNDDPTEDDQDEETIEIFDLALRKILTTTPPYTYGQAHVFTIQVFNQGNVPATNVVVNDYVPVGYGFTANNGWTSAGPGLIQNTIAGPIVPGGSITLTLQLTLLQSDGGERNWINYAEISSGNGPSGPGFDADSSPNSNGPNENAVVPGGLGDNDITSTTDSGIGSQDDHDPAGPSIFDLALTKIATTAAPSYSYGQTVTYEIEVFNQGNLAASNIQLSDYIPCGLQFNPASPNNGSWTPASAGRLTRTLPGVLNPGASATVLLDLVVTDCYTNPSTAWTNYTEISAATNVVTGLPGLDIDSAPDTNNGNDSGGVPDFNGVISGTDNTINNQNGDEDDHDPHRIQVFDLALRKVVDSRGPYMIGQTATFRITVFNQGNVTATNIVVNDYIRSGFTFPANPGWSMITAPTPFADGLLQYTLAGPLLPGQSQEIVLNLTVGLDVNPAIPDWYNYAEIRSSRDDQGNNRNDDADSTPNTNSPFENQVVPDGPWDNDINGNGPLVNEDEDDHDPDMILVVGGLGDTVWKDLNGNGIQDQGEPGVRNVIARLQDCSGNTLAVTLTDNTGFYFFNNLIPGNYRVQFDVSGALPGCQYTLQNQGGDDETDSDVDINGLGHCMYLNAGVYDSTYDAGLLVLAEIGDIVWHDMNANGMQNTGEPGIPNVRVELYRGDGTLYGVTYTDANGYYLFDELYPGDYYVRFISPAGFDLTLANQGASDAFDSDVDGSNGEGTTATTTLVSGESDMTWDAGFYTCVPVGEVVWYDFNKNDIRDDFENGINGLEVSIYRRVGSAWQLFDSMFTDHKPGTPSDDGYWKFCVPPGTYYVHVNMPPLGLVRVRPNVGGDPNRDSDLTNGNGPMTTGSFTVLSGQMKCDIGAGFYPMALTGNLVWIDENLNGIQEFNEAVVEGVTVQARDVVTHEILNSAVTDHNGQYELDSLERGKIYLKFELPAEYGQYVPTVARNGDDHEDSDVDGSFGARTTRMFDMEPSTMNMDIDMGIVLGVLPVDWLNVSARKAENHHLISWATAREVNASHYVVERKIGEASDFEAIGVPVKASGYSTQRQDYHLEDRDISRDGLYTYRVKQVDFDGSYTYSREVTLQQNLTNEVQLYPNPAKDMTNLSLHLTSDATVSIALYDDAGALIRQIKTGEVMEKGQYGDMLNLQDIPSGVYTVKIIINGEQWQKKLVIID